MLSLVGVLTVFSFFLSFVPFVYSFGSLSFWTSRWKGCLFSLMIQFLAVRCNTVIVQRRMEKGEVSKKLNQLNVCCSFDGRVRDRFFGFSCSFRLFLRVASFGRSTKLALSAIWYSHGRKRFKSERFSTSKGLDKFQIEKKRWCYVQGYVRSMPDKCRSTRVWLNTNPFYCHSKDRNIFSLQLNFSHPLRTLDRISFRNYRTI